MRATRLRVADFRNIEFADLDFGEAQRIFLVGKNGQGKTNLLESLSLLTALRSFRTRDARLLVRTGTKQAQVFVALDHESEGETELMLAVASNGTKTVETGTGTQVKRLSEFVGRFPAVVFSSDDIALLRGSPSGRRRWLDLTLSAVNADYFLRLQRYHRALEARNRLLKSPNAPETQLEAFEKILAENAARIVEIRSREMKQIAERFSEISAKISRIDEAAGLVYVPSVEQTDEYEWAEILRRSRAQDSLLRSTQKGPHRDDFSFRIFGHAASDYASEGQQRGMTLSLGLTQLALFRERLGIAPIVLADDVLGELDGERKSGFWSTVGEDLQIIATGTSLPESPERWRVFSVERGRYRA